MVESNVLADVVLSECTDRVDRNGLRGGALSDGIGADPQSVLFSRFARFSTA